MKNNYDNPYSFENVYGHSLAILQRHESVRDGVRSVHLDLGCGYGRIAEEIEDRLGLHYIGLDFDASSVESLLSRGKEAHRVNFSTDLTALKEVLASRLQGRRIASITILDVLEHLPEPTATLTAIRELLQEHGALLVTSVPNGVHRDVGFKMAFGRYDKTSAGILDHTHVAVFTDSSFKDLLASHGLHVIDRNDVSREHSDQAFPRLHPALADGSLLSTFLRSIRGQVDGFAVVNQFVFGCLPGPIQAPQFLADEKARAERAPFLSIITRTQGRRPSALRDVLLCLAAQTCQDFELLIVGHKLDLQAQLSVEKIIFDMPADLHGRIRFVRVDHGNRTTPLNIGFSAARGSYVTILDDDDLPFGHWVQSFRDGAVASPGKIVRTVAVRQETDEVRTMFSGNLGGPRATGGFDAIYPKSFDFFEHLRTNHTPGLAMAFPRAVFSEMNVRFDESLTTAEDWDFMMRAAFLCGVHSVESVTCAYRWWQSHETSRVLHGPQEWRENHNNILGKMNRQVVLLPAGSTRRICELMERVERLQSEVDALRGDTGFSGPINPHDPLQVELADILNSNSWKLGIPLRRVTHFLARKPLPVFRPALMSDEQLQETILEIKKSKSWRIAASLRRMLGR